jgi:hypothetical protein
MGKIKEKIEFEETVFDIYNPEFSSEEETESGMDLSPALVSTCSLSGENG